MTALVDSEGGCGAGDPIAQRGVVGVVPVGFRLGFGPVATFGFDGFGVSGVGIGPAVVQSTHTHTFSRPPMIQSHRST